MEKKDLYLSDEQLEKLVEAAWGQNKHKAYIGTKVYDVAISKASADYAVKQIMGALEDIAFKDKNYRVWGQKLLISDEWRELKKLWGDLTS